MLKNDIRPIVSLIDFFDNQSEPSMTMHLFSEFGVLEFDVLFVNFAAETFPEPGRGRTVTSRFNAERTLSIDESISRWKTLQAFRRRCESCSRCLHQ